MRKLLFIILTIATFSNISYAQVANRLNPAWAYIDTSNVKDYFMVTDLNHPQLVFRLLHFDSARIGFRAMHEWFRDTVKAEADKYYYPLFNPAGYISGITGSDVTTALGYAPSNFSGSYHDLVDTPYLFNGDYNSLTNKPSLSSVATSGDYGDLTNKPALFDGNYNNLTNKPTIPTNNNQLTNGANYITSEGAPVQSVNGQTGSVNIPLGDSVEFYNSSGKINQKIKVFTQTYIPNTGNGYAMDISAAGFSTILSVQVSPAFNTSNAGQVHDFEIKSVTTSQITMNITTPNALNVSLVGLTLLGVPTFIGSGTGTTIYLTVIGY